MKKGSNLRKRIPQVLLIIDAPWAYQREFLSGISQYCFHHESWALYIQVLGLKKMLCHLDAESADGIIDFSSDLKKNKQIAGVGVPVIIFTGG